MAIAWALCTDDGWGTLDVDQTVSGLNSKASNVGARFPKELRRRYVFQYAGLITKRHKYEDVIAQPPA